MDIHIIAETDALGTRVREVLAAAGQACPASAVVREDQARTHLARAHPEVVIVALGNDPESASATVARIRGLTATPLLAVGRVSDPKIILRILRAGAVDFVDESELESELADAIARLRANRETAAAAPGRLLVVLSPSGGSGSSLVAANLAVAMAKTHERTLLIDLKPRCGDLAAMLDLKPSHTLQDLCRVVARIDRSLLEQTLARHATGVSLLACSRGFHEHAATAEGLARIIDLGRSMFPRLVFDADPSLSDESLGVLRAADAVLLVMRLEFNSLRNAKTSLDHLERQGIDPKRIRLVGNRKGQPKEIAPAKVEEALGKTFFALIPDDPKAALGAQNNGVPVLMEYPSSWLSKAILKLAASLDALPAHPVANHGLSFAHAT